MVNATGLLLKFRDFISLNWEFISDVDEQDQSDALKIDWLQANWEMLAEQQLSVPPTILEVYGDGADNGKAPEFRTPYFHLLIG